MGNTAIIILFFITLVVIVGVTFFFSFMIVKRTKSRNDQYGEFARVNGYEYDKAMVYNEYYRKTKKAKGPNIKIPINGINELADTFTPPVINKYADFTSFPFDNSFGKQVSQVITGEYNGTHFRAFTFVSGGLNGGSTYQIIIVHRDKPASPIQDNMFYENGFLVKYTLGHLDVNTLHQEVLSLRQIV